MTVDGRAAGAIAAAAAFLVAATIAAAFLVAATIAAAFVPDMRAWGVNVLRFAPPGAWVFLLVAVAAFVPPVAHRVAPVIGAFGDGLVRGGRTVALAAVAVGALAFLLPDRGLVVGDAQLRRGTLETEIRAEIVYPQAMPLELALHVELPRFFADAGVMDAPTAARVIGALEAALLVVLAAVFARALGLGGAAAAVAWSALTWGGWLGLFTGYAKALAELGVLAAAVAALGVRLVRSGRGALVLGVVVAVGLLLHRGALAVVPGAVVAGVLAWRAHAPRGTRAATGRRPAAFGAREVAFLAAPIVLALVVSAGRLAGTLGSYDTRAHFASEDVARSGGIIAAAFTSQRLFDLVNVFVFLAPALAPGLAVLLASPRRFARAEIVLLATLAALQVGLVAFVHPAQGVFRDWDVFVPAGVALAALAAGALGLAPAVAPAPDDRRKRNDLGTSAAIALAATFLVPPAFTLPWLFVSADATRSLARAEAFVTEPPPRTPVEQAKMWDFLGAAYFREGRPLDAARAFATAATSSGNARLFVQQGMAARQGGDLAQAQQAFAEAARRAPANEAAWLGLGEVSWAQGDLTTSLAAARALAGLAPGDSARRARVRSIEQAIATPSPRPPILSGTGTGTAR